jgi:hypothetical protein
LVRQFCLAADINGPVQYDAPFSCIQLIESQTHKQVFQVGMMIKSCLTTVVFTPPAFKPVGGGDLIVFAVHLCEYRLEPIKKFIQLIIV